jgi:hypothetical protein
MIQVRDKQTGADLGTIHEDQLRTLSDMLEEESSSDTDYYINRDTVNMLEQGGADSDLVSFLRTALGERPEMEIEWSEV